MSRPSAYTTELGERICEYLAEGHSLRDVARMPGMPAFQTMQRWAWNAKQSDSDFVGQYARAREIQAHSEFDGLKDLERELKEGKLEPHAGRVVIDTIKWRLSKMLPRVYGERSHLEVSGGLRVETVKDHAPEWMQELLAAPKAITASDEDEDTIH